jgi:enoyl-CoA hydratase/carnithine racemase
MSVPPVLYDKRGHVAYVTINRPEVLNAMDLGTHEEFGRVWDDFEADDDMWVGVLTGAGTRAFSVGQDLKELAARNANGTAEPSSFGSRGKPGWPRLTERFSFAKPIVARVNGYALGGGFELALACDIIVAADHATFGLPEAKLGLIPGAGGAFRLVRQLPYRIAMGMLMTGRQLQAPQALAYGLVNEVVAADALDERVDAWVADLLESAPLSVRAVKEAARLSVDMPLEQAFTAQYAWEECRMHSQDAIEGPSAFTEKRRPRWQGR